MRATLRHDLATLVSWLLLALAVAAIGTGIVADVWDLNDFRWHRWAGYGLTVGAIAHVAFTWRRLTAYTRTRVRQVRRSSQGRDGPVPPGRSPSPRGPRSPLSRRGLLATVLAGGAGLLVGRGLRQPPVVPGGEDLGVVYHRWSEPDGLSALASVLDWGDRPAMRTTHPEAPRRQLPAVPVDDGPPVGAAIQARASVRSYSEEPMSQEQLARLLLLTDGLRPGSGDRRTAPSAGALYPIEVYPVVHAVEGLDAGVHHYDPFTHELSLLAPGDMRQRVVAAGLHQDFLGAASVTIVLTFVFQRLRFRYQERAYRYGMLEAGHIAQNTYLAAESMGLGVCAVGAFRDDELNELLGVDGREEAAVYLLSVGTTD